MSSEARRLYELRRELWHRQCRQNLLACATALLDPLPPAKHHRLIIAEVAAVAEGRAPRLILIAPPGSAKTTYTSHVTPAWFFATHPSTNVIAVSHTSEFAEKNSLAVQRLIRNHAQLLGYDLQTDALGLWETTNGCTYLAAGVGQAIRGFRADFIICDDPIRSRAEAESEVSRAALWEFFHSDLLPRLKPRGGVVLIATAYHESDLMCRLEREQSDLWRVLRLPAIAEQDDPLNRKEGEPLWADDDVYGYGERLLELRDQYERQGRSRDWYSQYQGRPRPPEGALFRPANMPIFAALPALGETVRAWDLASSVRGDWTCGLKLSRIRDFRHFRDTLVITDVQRMRGTPEQVRHLVRTVAEADGRSIKVWLPQDPAQAGADQADSYVRLLSGFRVATERQTGNKVTRADAVASQCNVGRVGLLQVPWNAALLDELGSFPSGQHDDQVDALSLAFSKLETSSLECWARMSDSYNEATGEWRG
jgi:predicted phage terminase large subunit-like protein